MNVALTIAGSDSSGGAGIQADLKTFQRCGVYGVCVVTAVTAQSPARVERVFPVPAREVTAQVGAVCNSVRVSAVKTGMLWSRETVRAVSRVIEKRRLRPLVVIESIRRPEPGSPYYIPAFCFATLMTVLRLFTRTECLP